jgi:hypothetical protein
LQVIITLLAIEALVTAAFIWLAQRVGATFRQSMILVALPIPLLVCAAWGAIFWVSPATTSRPSWVVDALGVFFLTSIALGVAIIVLAKGFRIPAAAFAVVQVPATLLIAFFATMEVTGSWI